MAQRGWGRERKEGTSMARGGEKMWIGGTGRLARGIERATGWNGGRLDILDLTFPDDCLYLESPRPSVFAAQQQFRPELKMLFEIFHLILDLCRNHLCFELSLLH